MTLFIPDLPEFRPLVDGLRTTGHCRIAMTATGYWQVTADQEIVLNRKALGLSAALWNSALSGGFVGRIVEFGRDVLRIADEPA
jgi:hypothetical protein